MMVIELADTDFKTAMKICWTIESGSVKVFQPWANLRVKLWYISHVKCEKEKNMPQILEDYTKQENSAGGKKHKGQISSALTDSELSQEYEDTEPISRAMYCSEPKG